MDEKLDIPHDVRTLLARHFDSVVQLELLLLLQRDANRPWTSDEAARELRIEPGWTAAQLEHLATHGLLGRVEGTSGTSGTYRFATDSAELGATVERLARCYAEQRVRVVALIYSKPADSLRTFADAFRLRKEGNRDG